MDKTGKTTFDAERFKRYHRTDFDIALKEIRSGSKKSHWIWFIFPQLRGLGHSAYSDYFGLDGLQDAISFYETRTLRNHLRKITKALLELDETDINKVMPGIDALKLRSSMTLFDKVSPNDIFAQVLDRYYGGNRDELTLAMLDK